MNKECGGHKHSGWLPLLEVFLKDHISQINTKMKKQNDQLKNFIYDEWEHSINR